MIIKVYYLVLHFDLVQMSALRKVTYIKIQQKIIAEFKNI